VPQLGSTLLGNSLMMLRYFTANGQIKKTNNLNKLSGFLSRGFLKASIIIISVLNFTLCYPQTKVQVMADQPAKLEVTGTETLVVKKNDTYYFGENILVTGGLKPYSFSWLKNNVIIGTNQVLQLPPSNASGTFTLIIKDSKNCKISVLATDNKEVISSPELVVVYPVPASDFIIVDMKDFPGVVYATVSDVRGTILLVKPVAGKTRLELNLPTGLYFIRIESTGGKILANKKISVVR
jgi:hypothetical protein